MLYYGIVVRKDMDVNEHTTTCMYMYLYVHTLRRKTLLLYYVNFCDDWQSELSFVQCRLGETFTRG